MRIWIAAYDDADGRNNTDDLLPTPGWRTLVAAKAGLVEIAKQNWRDSGFDDKDFPEIAWGGETMFVIETDEYGWVEFYLREVELAD